MHSQHERNQALLADYYLDLLRRQRELLGKVKEKQPEFSMSPLKTQEPLPTIGMVDLPYVGSTEAATNLRESAANRVQIIARFTEILDGQLDHFPFDRPANIIYGAGGCSGILGGLVTTRAVDEGFRTGRRRDQADLRRVRRRAKRILPCRAGGRQPQPGPL